jgi:outer membrane protein TolC
LAWRCRLGAYAARDKNAAAATFALSAQSIARRRYDAGAITYQTLLNAELIAQADQVAALSARIDCDQDIVALFVAMGDADPTTSAGSGVQHTGTIVKASSKS